MNPGKRKAPEGTGADATNKTYRQRESYTEDVWTVGELVAGILDAFVPETPLELQDVVRIRAAVRRVLEAHLAPEDEDRLLAGLARAAARSPLPLWSLAAMEAEILGGEPPELLPLDVVGRARTLRLWGHGRCPACRQPLISEAEIDRDARRRRWAEQDGEVRRLAVPEELVS
jgi:hypothetical protein